MRGQTDCKSQKLGKDWDKAVSFGHDESDKAYPEDCGKTEVTRDMGQFIQWYSAMMV